MVSKINYVVTKGTGKLGLITLIRLKLWREYFSLCHLRRHMVTIAICT